MAEAARLIGRGIRLNCTLSGPTQTPMMPFFEEASAPAALDAIAQPIGRRAVPEEQVAALIFLNSPAASCISGAVSPVDGGFSGASATGKLDLSAMYQKA